MLELYRSFEGDDAGATIIRIDDAGRWSVSDYRRGLKGIDGVLTTAAQQQVKEALAAAAKALEPNGWNDPEWGG